MSKQDIHGVQRELLQRIQTEGVLVAYEASLAVARDSKAPAPARATASATLFRVAGYFDKPADGSGDVEPHEMTPEQLAAAVSDALRRAQARKPDIFD